MTDGGFTSYDLTNGDLRDVWGASANDVWAMTGMSLFHWDGTTWALSSHVTWNFGNTLRAIWGADASHLWIVGGMPRSAGSALLGDSSTWTPTTAKCSQFNGVWGRSASEVWAVGGYGSNVVAKWDGVTWTTQELGREILTGVWGSPAGDLWTVGGSAIWYRRP